MGARHSSSNSNSRARNDESQSASAGPVFRGERRDLLFHDTYGKHIKISDDKKTAERTKRYDFGITFSREKIIVNELASFEISDCYSNNSMWTGDLRLGVTVNDPAEHSQEKLPPYAASHLDKENGYWAKSLPEGYGAKDSKISFYINQMGVLKVRVNQEEYETLFNDLPPNDSFWIIFDVYGNTTSIRLLDIRPLEDPQEDDAVSLQQVQLRSVLNITQPSALSEATCERNVSSSSSDEVDDPLLIDDHFGNDYDFSMDTLDSFGIADRASPVIPHHEEIAEVEQVSVMSEDDAYDQLSNIYHKDLRLLDRDCKFLSTCGAGVEFVSEKQNRIETNDKNASCLAFSGTPITPGKSVYFKVFKTSFAKNDLKFGVTSCNPNSLDATQLPNDPKLLLQRENEYWVVEEVVSELNDGDLVSISYGYDGYLNYDANNSDPQRLCQCDNMQVLWLFIDLSGNVQDLFMIAADKTY